MRKKKQQFFNQAPPKPAVKSWYVFKNQTDKSADILIMQTISAWGVSALQFANDVRRLGVDTTLNIHISCQGGDVTEGNEIYNILKGHQGQVNITIGALCASIATVIAMAGDHIKMASNGFFMIHNPWTITAGDSKDMRRNADIMDKMKDNIVRTYLNRASVPEKEIRQMMDDETWLTAEEALEKGFIDEIGDAFDVDEESDILNRFDLSKFSNSAKAISSYKALLPEPQKPPVVKDEKPPKDEKKEHPNKPQFHNEKEKNKVDLDPNNPEHKALIDAEAKKVSNKMYQARLDREKDIDGIVMAVRKRENKDFSKLAAQAKQEEWSPEKFAAELIKCEDFTPHKVEGEVLGSGNQPIKDLSPQASTRPGDIFVNSATYKAAAELMRSGARQVGSVMVTTPGFMNVTTTAGLTSIEKLPEVITLGVRPLMIKDLISPGATQNTLIRYIRETAFVNGAGMVAESAAKPEAAFTFDEIDAPVKKIAVFTKMSDEMFKDFAQVASVINQRLPYMVNLTEDNQILNGDGTGQNLTGILSTPGIQTQAKGADTNVDALYKALTKIRYTGFFEPDAFVINPLDWEMIRLTKDLNGQYFAGGPFTGAYGNNGGISFDTLWGKPVAITAAITQGTALAGAFRLGAQYFQREGMIIESTNSDTDDFTKNRITVRAETRLALAVYRALAFCQVTGLAADA